MKAERRSDWQTLVLQFFMFVQHLLSVTLSWLSNRSNSYGGTINVMLISFSRVQGEALMLSGGAQGWMRQPTAKKMTAYSVAPKAAKGGLKSFDDVVANPKDIWGRSADEVGEILGSGWERAPLNSGEDWKFVQKNGDGFVSYTTGNSHHPNSIYYKINSGASGKTKVVGKGYVPAKGDKSKIIYAE